MKNSQQNSCSLSSLAIGIVTYNNSDSDINRLLKSLDVAARRFRDTYKNSEFVPHLFIIDNGTKTTLNNAYSRLTRVKSRGNIGYSRAFNILMKHALESNNHSHILSANPDGFFHPDFFIELESFSKKYPDDLIEAIQFPEEHPKLYDKNTCDTNWASGCCCLFPRQLVSTVGYLDENFFLYAEDVDYSWRVRASGRKVRLCSNAIYVHYVLNRRPNPKIVKFFHESGRYLAIKYKHSQFQKHCETVLLAEGFYKSKENLPKYRLSIAARSLAKVQRISDFSHFFHFSEVRWK